MNFCLIPGFKKPQPQVFDINTKFGANRNWTDGRTFRKKTERLLSTLVSHLSIEILSVEH